jgi:predicted RNA-binding protein with PUA-like domain
MMMSTSSKIKTSPARQYWLMKSEPCTFHWQDLVRLQRDCWDGVRNHQAKNILKSMNEGDLAFFYHSVSEKSVVGVCQIVKTAYPDPTVTEGPNPWVVVDVVPVCPVVQSVTLEQIKQEACLQEMALLKQSRLSVQPVEAESFFHILAMGKTTLPKGF